MGIVNIGYGNYVNAQRCVAMVGAESAPIKRIVQDARDAGKLVDASCGRKTKTVLIADSGHIVLSALSTGQLTARLEGRDTGADAQEEEYDE